ncbi:MAG: hypothetical protein ACTHMZ_14600, partial [Actinomycetes bacterium]
MTGPTEPVAGPTSTVDRTRSIAAGALHTTQAAMLLAALPVILAMFIGSAWEGGDLQEKQRIAAWSMLAGPANVVGI